MSKSAITLVCPTPKTSSKRPLLERLGFCGMATIEPVILAAFALGVPLLLIGGRGSAKTMLLMRLYDALKLEWRHYNASTLNYDDLVGYPRIDDDKVTFIETEGSVWEAEAVILDEISRCRVDMQNRLFSIILETRVLGIKLPRLIYRNATMNPPATDDNDDPLERYVGSEPLDAALSDRFSFITQVPEWSELNRPDRLTIIRLEDEPIDPADAKDLRNRLESIREGWRRQETLAGAVIAEYLTMIFDLIAKTGIRLSARRARVLYQNAIAIHVARKLDDPGADLGESLWLALINGLPQRAEGRKIDEVSLIVAHREAWKAANLEHDDPRRWLFAEPDPVSRAIRAAYTPGLTVAEMTGFVADGLAEAPDGSRHVLAHHVLGSPGASHLATDIAEQAAHLCLLTLIAQPIESDDATQEIWNVIADVVNGLDPDNDEDAQINNLLFGLLASGRFRKPDDVHKAVHAWRETRSRCADETAAIDEDTA